MARIKFFGYFGHIVGQKEITLEIEGMRVMALLNLLKEKYGDELYRIVVADGKIREDVLVMLNQKSAKEEDIVMAGDEVAILPPVTGG